MKIPLAKPPWSKLGKKLESLTRKALHNFSMLEGIDSLCIALSGGKDSLSMLYLLHAINGKGFLPCKICAIHIEGEFSCGANVDKSFLQKICNDLEIPLISKKTHPIKGDDFNCYVCSRERRKAIFTAAKEEGAKTIAFGHHREDQNETLLMNLLQKGEFASFLPKLKMVYFGITIIRPLIYISEEDLISFANYYGFYRYRCQCPYGNETKRKETKELINELERAFPHVKKNLSHAAFHYGSKKAEKSPCEYFSQEDRLKGNKNKS